jgi:hypothetical protein
MKIIGAAQFTKALREIEAGLQGKILRDALKAGAEVVADAARVNSPMGLNIVIKVAGAKGREGLVRAQVQVVGKEAFKAPWVEFGTAAHIITRRSIKLTRSRRRGIVSHLVV